MRTVIFLNYYKVCWLFSEAKDIEIRHYQHLKNFHGSVEFQIIVQLKHFDAKWMFIYTIKVFFHFSIDTIFSAMLADTDHRFRAVES